MTVIIHLRNYASSVIKQVIELPKVVTYNNSDLLVVKTEQSKDFILVNEIVSWHVSNATDDV